MTANYYLFPTIFPLTNEPDHSLKASVINFDYLIILLTNNVYKGPTVFDLDSTSSRLSYWATTFNPMTRFGTRVF